MANQEELAIVVRLRDFATAEFRKLSGVITGFGRLGLGAFRGITGAIFSMKGALAGLGVALTVKGIHDLIRATANEADELRDLSIQLGTTTEFLSELKFAGSQAGVEIGELEVGLRQLLKALGEVAATGTGAALVALDRLDPAAKKVALSTASVEEKFTALARAIRKLPESERVFVASKLFGGRGGARFLQVIADDFDKAREAAKRFGISISREQADAADAFNDAIGELGGALKGLRNQVILPLLPELKKLVEAMTEGLVKNRPQILGFFADLIEASGEAGKGFANMAGDLAVVIDHIKNLQIIDIFSVKVGKAAEEAEAASAKIKSSFTETGDAIAKNAKTAADRIRSIAVPTRDIDEEFESILKAIAAVPPKVEEFEVATEKVADDTERWREELERSIDLLDQLRNPVRGASDAFAELREESLNWGRATHDAVLDVADALAGDTTDAIVGLIDGTKSAKEAFRDMAKSILSDIARIIIQTSILKAVQAGLGGLFAGSSSSPGVTSGASASGGLSGGQHLPRAKGGIFALGEPVAFAGGGIVGSPSLFPLARGRTGLMGEDGPEGILPLKRTRGGRLGVETTGGGVTQNFNITINSRRDRNEEDARQILAVVAQGMKTKSTFREAMQ